MKWFAITIALSMVFAGAAGAARPILSVGPFGPPNPMQGARSEFSEPPDLNGLVGSSEIISSLGLESEIANDFSLDTDTNLCQASVWGGYYNNQNGCADNEISTFRAKIYNDAGCIPGALLSRFQGTGLISLVGCQSGVYPIYRVDLGISQSVAAGALYWLGFQAGDHEFPPQWGRLAAPSNIDCDSMFQSVLFGFPDWTDCANVFGVAYDASQELLDIYGSGGCIIPHLPSGVREVTRSVSWGAIKGLYR